MPILISSLVLISKPQASLALNGVKQNNSKNQLFCLIFWRFFGTKTVVIVFKLFNLRNLVKNDLSHQLCPCCFILKIAAFFFFIGSNSIKDQTSTRYKVTRRKVCRKCNQREPEHEECLLTLKLKPLKS